MRPLVMLDRDGTINAERHYLSAPDQLELLPGAAAGIRLLRELGLATIVLTNQSAIGRGYFDQAALARIHARLRDLLAGEGAALDAIYICPHRPDEQCNCRKPETGLALQAACEFRASLAHSFMVGDKACDIELGKRVGATTVLVRTGYGAQTARDAAVNPEYVVDDLLEAAQVIQRLMAGAEPERRMKI